MPTPLMLDGIYLNGAEGFVVVFDRPSSYVVSTTVRQQRSRFPLREGSQFEERRFPFSVVRKSELTTHESIMRIFDPYRNANRTLVASHDDNSGEIQCTVRITSFSLVGPAHYQGEFSILSTWQETTAEDAVSGGTVYVLGNSPAYPTLTVTPYGGTAFYRQISAVDLTGRGLQNHPLMGTVDMSGVGATAASNVELFWQGQPIPFQVINPGSATAKVFWRADLPPSGTSSFDLYYGASVSNSRTANQYDDGGMDLNQTTNQVWHWNDFRVSDFPVANGIWHLGFQGAATDLCDILEYAGTGVTLAVATSKVSQDPGNPRDPDRQVGNVLALVTGVEAGTITNLKRVHYTSALVDVANVGGTAFVRYQGAGSADWREAWGNLTAADKSATTVTSALNVAGAVAIVVGSEDIDTVGHTATVDVAINTTNSRLKLSGNSGGTAFSLSLNPTKAPSVSIGAAGTAFVIDDDLSIVHPSGTTTVDFDTVYLRGPLEIDTAERGFSHPSGDIRTAGEGIVSSDIDQIVVLEPGEHTWTNPGGGSVSLAYRKAWVL
jgi:hypothetical protein